MAWVYIGVLLWSFITKLAQRDKLYVLNCNLYLFILTIAHPHTAQSRTPTKCPILLLTLPFTTVPSNSYIHVNMHTFHVYYDNIFSKSPTLFPSVVIIACMLHGCSLHTGCSVCTKSLSTAIRRHQLQHAIWLFNIHVDTCKKHYIHIKVQI